MRRGVIWMGLITAICFTSCADEPMIDDNWSGTWKVRWHLEDGAFPNTSGDMNGVVDIAEDGSVLLTAFGFPSSLYLSDTTTVSYHLTHDQSGLILVNDQSGVDLKLRVKADFPDRKILELEDVYWYLERPTN